MHFLNTLTNSFVVGEKDGNGNIISMQGYPKGGLTYLIVNDNVKFYLREDYFYKNVVFSADVPLLINGIPVGINALPTALKEIFKQEKDEIGVDVDFNPESFNAIANAPVTNRFNADEASINALSGDVETLGEQLSNKADSSAVTSIAEAKVEEYTYDKATIDDKIANVDVSGQLVNYLTISGAAETYQPLSAMTGYATEQWVIDQHYITGVDLSDYAKIEDIPTSNSGLTNDAGYITSSALDGYATEQWVQEQGYLTEHQDISGKQDVSGMTAYTTTAVTSALNDVVTGHTADTTIHVTSTDKQAWNAKADLSDIPDVSDYFDGAEYVSSAKTIYFTHEGVVKTTIDCTEFVIDGMIDDVSIQTLSGQAYLVIDFNTASGKEDILIPLSDIFDPSNYYTKSEVDTALSGKQNTLTAGSGITIVGDVISCTVSGDVTKAEFDELSGKVDTNNEVASRAINDLYVQVSGKAETSDVVAVANDVSALSGKVDVNEEVASRAINDLYIKVDDKANVSAVTAIASDVSILSGKVDVNEEIASRAINDLYLKVDGKAESSAITEVSENLTTLSGKVDTNEEVAARAIADLQVRKLDASAYTPVDLSNYYTSAQTNAAIDAAVSGKADASRVDEIDEVAARAIDELFEIKLDASAYTPTDLSEYWTSGQTDTAINAAVSGKMDTSAYTPVTVDQTLSSGSSNAIANSAVTNGFENYTVKQDSENGVVRYWSWKTPSKPYGGAGNTHIANFSINGRCPLSQQNGSNNYIDNFQLLETSAFTAYSGSVETALSGKADVSAVTAVSDRVNEIDEVAARAIDELYDTKADISDVPTSTSAVTSGSTDVITSGGVYQQLGGLKILQITQNDYDNLQVKDNSTLYVIVN